MHLRLKRLALIIAAAFMVCSNVNTVNASSTDGSGGNTVDVEITQGDEAYLQSDGAQGSTQSAERDTTSRSGGGDTHHYTQAELNAQEEKNALRNFLTDLRNRALANSHNLSYSTSVNNDGTGGVSGSASWGASWSSDLDRLFNLGVEHINETEIRNLLNHLSAFNSYLGQDCVDSFYNRDTDDPPVERIEPDESVRSLTADERAEAIEAIRTQEGLDPSPTNNYACDMGSTDGGRYYLELNPDRTPPLSSFGIGHSSSSSTNGRTGLRNDLFLGGFGLSNQNSWSDRFNDFGRVLSNSMEDFIEVAYLQEYSIQSVERDRISDVDFTSDLRRWAVYDPNDMSTPINVLVTNTPRHELSLQTFEPGNYVVVAEQMAEYTVSTYIRYNECQYLFDAETGNLLYYREQLVSNHAGGSVNIGNHRETGYRPTGDEFDITVNDLGQVEMDGSATQRVE